MARPVTRTPRFTGLARPLAQAPAVAKGRLINVRTRTFKSFMFNPTEVSIGHGWSWGSHTIAGASHPILSGGSGTARDVSFTLRLDGDRGRVAERRGRTEDEDSDTSLGLSVQRDIEWYEGLTYPERTFERGFRMSTPPVLVLTMGSLFDRSPCVVENVSINILSWTPRMEPVRADVQLKLVAYERATVFYEDVIGFEDSAPIEGPPLSNGDGENR